ncbi:phage tail tape measure protein [Morganella morganii]|uniref:Phage tail tape measure protein n=1 Tax=Morganella morganii TaxID=582 RepID=A0A8I0U5W7_MORMO|nr:phage tail tape measure protein [Morganella morganii]MBE8611531.1 phage tail tape measure protein [Morganella morganii]
MSTSFSLGVVIGAAVASSFSSAMGSTQRTLNKLTQSTSRLKTHQNELSRRAERYGQIGAGAAQRLRQSYDSVGASLKRLEEHQARLLKWDTRVNNMLLKRQQIMGELRNVIAGGAAAVALGYKATATYSGEELMLRSTSQGARNYDRQAETQLLAQMRVTSRETTQTVTELLRSVDDFVDAGWDRQDAANLTQMLGKVSTLYNIGIQDTTKVADALVYNLGYDKDKGVRHALNLLADGGNRVGFEFPDIAPNFSKLAESFEKRGIVGDEAITQIVSALGAARLTIRDKSEVMTGLQGWMDTSEGRKMESRFNAMGVDYIRSRADYMKNGMSDFEASLRVTQRYLQEVGNGQFMGKFTALDGNAQAQSQLIQSFGLGQIVSSPEQIRFINAMAKNWGAYEKNKDTLSNRRDPNYVNMAYNQKTQTLSLQTRQLKNELSILSSVFGETIAPVIRENIEDLKDGVQRASAWVSNNKELIQSAARLVVTYGKYFLMLRGGWLVSKLLYTSTLGWLFGIIRSGTGVVSRLATLTTEYRTLGKSTSWLFNLTFKTARGFGALLGQLRGLGPRISHLAAGAGKLGRLLGGGLLSGLKIVGNAILWVSRALMLNPIGLIITRIAVAAYLVYRYWAPVKGFFTRLWTGIQSIGTQIWGAITGFFTDSWTTIQTAFDGGLLGISELIINWSPLGLFYKAFAGVMNWFGVELPNNFTDFGKNILDGLINGIKEKWQSVKDTFGELTDGIKSIFTGEVEINSPSRVFMGYGGYLVEGLQLGIRNTAWKAEQTVKQLTQRMLPERLRTPRIPAVPFISDLPAGVSASGGAPADIRLTYSPVIHIKANPAETSAAEMIKTALRDNLPELECLLNEVLRRQQRRRFET